MPKLLTLIVACAENRVIGRNRRLPFDIPEDKAWYREKTAGHTVVLGRICFETWPGVLADGRQPIVVSSHPERILANAMSAPRLGDKLSTPLTVTNVPAALALAQTLPGEIMICGGQRIYEETLPLADRLILTLVHADVPGDTWFPEWRHLPWRETWKRESHNAEYRYTFSILERQRAHNFQNEEKAG